MPHDQDSQQMYDFIHSLLGALTAKRPTSDPAPVTTSSVAIIELTQLGTSGNLLEAKCVMTDYPSTPVRVYSGSPKVVLPIVLSLMHDKVTLIANGNSPLVLESIQMLTHDYQSSKQSPNDNDGDESNDPCHTCNGCHGCDTELEPADTEYDSVHNPSHYQLPGLNGLEVMDVRSSLLQTIPEGVPYEFVTSWNESWTYLTRMWGKNGLEDAKKAQVYLSRLIDLWESHNHSH